MTQMAETFLIITILSFVYRLRGSIITSSTLQPLSRLSHVFMNLIHKAQCSHGREGHEDGKFLASFHVVF